MANEQVVKKIVRLLPLPSVKDLVEMYNVKAMRKLSQNFLLDEKLNNKIVKVAGPLKNCEVLEVGPGPGSITRSIMNKNPQRIVLVEKDTRFLPTLQMLQDASPRPMHIIWDDILLYDMTNTFSEEKRRPWEDYFPDIHLIGNLPFSIATPLIIRWLKNISEKTSAWTYGRVRMTLTFQKEVAERMQAPVMTAGRCRLSVMCQNFCEVENKFVIPGRAFIPKPKVDVGVVHFRPRVTPIIPLPFDLVEKVVTSLFSHRQMIISRSLRYLFPIGCNIPLVARILEETALHPEIRSFQLSVQEIGTICYSYKRIIEERPEFGRYRPSDRLDENKWLEREEAEQRRIEEYRKIKITDDFY